MKNKPALNQRKIFWVIAIIAVAAIYQFAHPYLERQFNVELPTLVEEDNIATLEQPRRQWKQSDWEIPPSDSNQPLIGESAAASSNQADSSIQIPAEKNQTKTSRDNATKSKDGEPFELVSTGKKNRLRSPAGLVYGESHGEHRVDHVMKHGKNDPSRPVHSVFDGNKDDILRMIDEAYGLIKSGSKRVKKSPDQRLDFRTKYTVDMQRKVGYLGGKRGKRENYPPRSKITLVLDNEKFVVTAYPDR